MRPCGDGCQVHWVALRLYLTLVLEDGYNGPLGAAIVIG
jgi:hypothetical protein